MSLPGSDTHGHGCCRKVLSELKSLKALISSIYLTISDKNNNVNNDTVRETVDFGLPIQTRSQLAAFESKIQNVVASTQYKQFYKSGVPLIKRKLKKLSNHGFSMLAIALNNLNNYNNYLSRKSIYNLNNIIYIGS